LIYVLLISEEEAGEKAEEHEC